jgi:Peptidase_C39 like family
MNLIIRRITVVACIVLNGPVIAESGSRPKQYFISQEKDKTNLQAPKNNGDCGPTCLVMVAKCFGKIPSGFSTSPSSVERLISYVRELMTHKDNHKAGTNDNQIIRGAHNLGMQASEVKPLTLDSIDKELAIGHLVIAAGFPCAPGAFGPHHGYKKGNGGHYILVCKKTPDNRYIIDDPAGSYSGKPKERGTYKIARIGLAGFINSKDGGAVSISKN